MWEKKRKEEETLTWLTYKTWPIIGRFDPIFFYFIKIYSWYTRAKIKDRGVVTINRFLQWVSPFLFPLIRVLISDDVAFGISPPFIFGGTLILIYVHRSNVSPRKSGVRARRFFITPVEEFFLKLFGVLWFQLLVHYLLIFHCELWRRQYFLFASKLFFYPHYRKSCQRICDWLTNFDNTLRDCSLVHFLARFEIEIS